MSLESKTYVAGDTGGALHLSEGSNVRRFWTSIQFFPRRSTNHIQELACATGMESRAN